MIVRKRAYARVGLCGNPSDGYYGKTIAFTIRDFWAEAVLYESPEVELRPARQDHSVFPDLDSLLENIERTGYYGGIRLMKAAVKTFTNYCKRHGIKLPDRNFTLRYQTNIPRQVGLGGSSAIITAAMRALMSFYGVNIPDHVLPNVVLDAETKELQLTAGLQDRVVQAYEGLIYMDFDKKFMEKHGYGRYERLDTGLLSPVYMAYRTELGKESDSAHIKTRGRYERGEEEVVKTMDEVAALAEEARKALIDGDSDELHRLLDRNFDLRAKMFPISKGDQDMIERARSAGASAKFTGSGGAIVGTYGTDEVLNSLKSSMEEGGYEFLLPSVLPPQPQQAL